MGPLKSFSQVQNANMQMLLMIQEEVKLDAAMACCRFNMHSEQAEFIASLTHDQICAIVAHIGPQSLFPPRTDLVQVLSLPLPLLGAMLMVRPPPPAPIRATPAGYASDLGKQ